jgi:hypothetical protein
MNENNMWVGKNRPVMIAGRKLKKMSLHHHPHPFVAPQIHQDPWQQYQVQLKTAIQNGLAGHRTSDERPFSMQKII